MTGPACGPLTGMRVIDCSRGVAGTRATGLLADHGADVIWVEPPGGDPFRDSQALHYACNNRGKRSVILDLKQADGRAKLDRLLAGADLFFESWRPGVAAKLGLGYPELHEKFPSLVCTSISGFGESGENTSLAGHEALVHAFIGTMGEQPGHRPGPIYEGLPFAGIGAAYLAVIGALSALYRRLEDGIGRRVETSLVDGALAYLSMTWGDTDDAPAPQLRSGGPPNGRLVARTFRCGDDEYLGVHTAAVGAFGRLMKVLGLENEFPPIGNQIEVGYPVTPEQVRIIDQGLPEIFASRPRAHWLERILAADICAIPELRPTEVFDEAQARHNQMVIAIDDPVLGEVEQVAPPAKFPSHPLPRPMPAPRPGEHTASVFAELDSGKVKSAKPRPGRATEVAKPLLAGLRILDVGVFYAGPYSSRLLADLGAEVIKLEPVYGDPLRGIARVFRSAQAGKRAIAADLKDEGLAAARKALLEWADVVHHNMRPGAAERLGVGYEEVRRANPRTVYLYAPGWGSTGPDKARQSFAPLVSGYVGVSHEVAGQFNPPIFPTGNEDPGNGLLGAVAILIGLLDRAKTGAGQYIENPQLNATMAHLSHIVRRKDGTVLGAARLDPLQRGVGPLDRLYETADGHICLVAQTDREIAALSRVSGIGIASDPRYATLAAREENADALSAALEDVFSRKSSAEWLSVLREARVPAEIPKPYNNAAFLRDPRNHGDGRASERPHPKHGRVREVACLVRVSNSGPVPHRLAPEMGEHTNEILAGLGYSAEQIEALRKKKVVR